MAGDRVRVGEREPAAGTGEGLALSTEASRVFEAEGEPVLAGEEAPVLAGEGAPVLAGEGAPVLAAEGEPVLAAEGLVKSYGRRRALDGFTLRVAAGEIVGLVGPNGAGKTTFVEVVTGLIRPEAGRVTIRGVDALRHPQRARRLLGVCPQETALYPSITVAGHLRLFAALAGLRGAAARRAVAGIAERMRLTDVLGKPAGLLSGGQRKRVQAATALVADRPLLLLDEPTVGADPLTRTALLDVVAARAAAGAGVVYTTHYLPELAELGASIAFARAGRVVARGSQAQLSLDDLFLPEPGEAHDAA
jgi:ABC-2 type transport system ATP-binding protein